MNHPITTIRQLADKLGVSRYVLDGRQRNYPINSEYTIKNGVRHYKKGVLVEWHKRCERINAGDLTLGVSVVINEGKDARLKGVPLDENPHSYRGDIRRFCAWAAGWHDAK